MTGIAPTGGGGDDPKDEYGGGPWNGAPRWRRSPALSKSESKFLDDALEWARLGPVLVAVVGVVDVARLGELDEARWADWFEPGRGRERGESTPIDIVVCGCGDQALRYEVSL